MLWRSRGDYGCVWTTHVRRTDAPGGPLGSTRITRSEVAARNRRARFPAAHCDGVLRIAPAADPARPLLAHGITVFNSGSETGAMVSNPIRG